LSFLLAEAVAAHTRLLSLAQMEPAPVRARNWHGQS